MVIFSFRKSYGWQLFTVIIRILEAPEARLFIHLTFPTSSSVIIVISILQHYSSIMLMLLNVLRNADRADYRQLCGMRGLDRYVVAHHPYHQWLIVSTAITVETSFLPR